MGIGSAGLLGFKVSHKAPRRACLQVLAREHNYWHTLNSRMVLLRLEWCSLLNRTYCSCRVPKFGVQLPHWAVGSQLPIAPIPGDLILSYCLYRHLNPCAHTYMNTYIYIIKNKIKSWNKSFSSLRRSFFSTKHSFRRFIHGVVKEEDIRLSSCASWINP